MTILVAHRANHDGPSGSENTIEAIEYCFSLGLMCEIDVRMHDGQLFLGHDSPQEIVSIDFLCDNAESLLVHCKDVESVKLLGSLCGLNIFGHSGDEFVLTSCGDIFCRVGIVEPGCICVMPELYAEPITKEMVSVCSHVVTDYPGRLQSNENNHYNVREE